LIDGRHMPSPKWFSGCCLQLDFDRALGRANARPDHLSLLAVHLPVAKVPDTSGAKLADARVADALAAPVGQVQSRLLAGDEDRHAAVGLGLAVGLAELDRPA